MKILISGATGFIGSYVTRLLCQSHTVAVLARPSSNPWRIVDCIDRVTLIPVDLENTMALSSAVLSFRPDVVVHLAWEGITNSARHDPIQVGNVMISMHLLEAAIQAGAKAWIGLGSQAEYGPHHHAITEQSNTNPNSLYGATKLATYYMTEQRALEAGLRFAWLRVFSTYGPTDHPESMIPMLIRSLLKGERPALTFAEQRWDYLFVEDAARAISLIATDAAAYGIFNLGSGKSLLLRSIIESIRNSIDPELPLGFGEIAYRPDQVMHLEASVEKLMKVVGWVPCTSLAEGLTKTIEQFFQKRLTHEKAY